MQGHLEADEQAPGRRVFGLLTGILVAARDAKCLEDALRTRAYPGNRWVPRAPSDHYTFAGEIPWSPEFAHGDADDVAAQLYRDSIQAAEGTPIEIETLAHNYAWERYHCSLNDAGGALVPSRSFSAAFDLRGIPQSFDQALPDGKVAAISLRAPAGFSGHILYLKEDLVGSYAAGRRLIWFIWGERQLHSSFPYPEAAWLSEVSRDGKDIWRLIRRGEELSGLLALRPRRRSRKAG